MVALYMDENLCSWEIPLEDLSSYDDLAWAPPVTAGVLFHELPEWQGILLNDKWHKTYIGPHLFSTHKRLLVVINLCNVRKGNNQYESYYMTDVASIRTVSWIF